MRELILSFWLALQLPFLFAGEADSLQTIRAFEQVSDSLASSGYVTDRQFRYIRDAGFSHVISLLPGDQSHEESVVTSLGMSFTNIGVDWNRPTMKNLDEYFRDMDLHRNEKVYLHCEANMRASAFLFMYRVIRQRVDRMEARVPMFAIWYPMNQWDQFIERGLEKYGLDPEYRFEPEFVRIFREYGPEAAREEVERIRAELAQEGLSGNEEGPAGEEQAESSAAQETSAQLPFSEVDLERVGDEYAADEETGKALAAYRLNTEIFPESREAWEKLGGMLLEEEDGTGAREAWEKVHSLDPDNLRAKRMLGRLGEKDYEIFWQGTGIDPGVTGDLAGTYDLGNSTLVFSAGNGKFTLQPSWSRKPLDLYADTPRRYFVHEHNWTFEFPEGAPGRVLFTTSGGNTYTGTRINK